MDWVKMNCGNVVFHLSNGKTVYINSIRNVLETEDKIRSLEKIPRRFILSYNGELLDEMRYVVYNNGEIYDKKDCRFKNTKRNDVYLWFKNDQYKRIKINNILYATFHDTYINNSQKVVNKDGNKFNLNIDNLELVNI